MTDSEFNDLLKRFEKGQCTAEERDLVEKWLDLRGGSRPIFKDDRERLRVGDRLRSSVLRKTGLEARSGTRTFVSSNVNEVGRMSLYRIAASILIIAIAGYGLLRYFEGLEEERYATIEIATKDGIRKVLLSDGSIVWLKPNSSLRYPRSFRNSGERRVELGGEALFEVEKNPAQPFIVNAGELTATVLGTSFNIKSTKQHIEVVVLTGSVSLTSVTDKEGVVVLPDEKVIYNGRNKHLTKVDTRIDRPVAEAIVTGTEYDMNFNSIRMSEVVRRIEGKFNAKMIMTDPSLGNCILTADFTDQSLTKTMDIIAAVLAVDYEIDGSEVTLNGTGCE